MQLTENISAKTKYAAYFVLAAIFYFVFFHRLDSFYLRTWDESVYSVYSYEMSHGGNLLIPTIDGKIDHLNDKPPLFFWSQILFIKIFGYNELSVRLPSALFASATALMLFYFLKKNFNFIFALCSTLILCTAHGFATFHSSRTGDMDSMLTFAITGFILQFYQYMENSGMKQLYLALFFLLIAFFTKSIAVFLLFPGLFLWMLAKKRGLFKDIKLYVAFGIFFAFIALFIYIRSSYEPDYFKGHMLDYLLKFRQPFYAVHDHPWDFYINNFYNERFAHYLFILPLSVAILVALREKNSTNEFVWLTLTLLVGFIVVISLLPTKCYWYDLPAFPLLAIMSGYFIWKAIIFILSHRNANTLVYVTFFGFLIPVYFAIKRSHNNDIPDQHTRRIEVVSEYFHNHKENLPYNTITVGNEQYITPLLFYKYYFRDTYAKTITLGNASTLKAEEIFITGNDSVKNIIKNNYDSETLENYKNATIYKIIKSKTS